MSPPGLRVLLFLLAVFAVPALAGPDESLLYVAEIRGAVTLWSWTEIGTARVTSRDVDTCPGGSGCRETQLWMTSEGSGSSLESIYPLRYLYTTVYRPAERSTLFFEELRRRRKVDNPGDYLWRHRLLWLAGGKDAATRYDLDKAGTSIPDAVAPWVTREKAEGITLNVKNERSVPMPLPALDRWGIFELLRGLPLEEKGGAWNLQGAGPKGPLSFKLAVQGKESLQIAGRSWDTWKVRIDERESGAKGDDPAPLYVWIATDAPHTPVRFDMDHDIGRLRLTLK